MNNTNSIATRTNKILAVIAVTVTIVFSTFIYYSLFHYSSFSIDDYKSDINWCKQFNDIPEYTVQINSKISAINAAKQAWSTNFNIGKCLYTVYYDKENDCWLIKGISIDYINPLYWFKSMSGGEKRAIIQSDGKILALILDV